VRLCVTGSAKLAALTTCLVMSCQARPTAEDAGSARREGAALATPLAPKAQAAGAAMAEAARKPRRETRRDEGEGGRYGNVDIPSAGRQSARMAGLEENCLLHRLFWSRMATATSAATANVAAGTLTAAAPTITGTVKAGDTLTAHAGNRDRPG
jgi:hypothetical protein